MFKSPVLANLYKTYGIDNLSYGKLADKLGDLYEEYMKPIFTSEDIWDKFNSQQMPTTIEEEVFYSTLKAYNIINIESVKVLSVPLRETGGPPKTDVHLLINDKVNIKVSVKHYHARHVTVAEFDVNTIRDEAGITDERTVALLKKHQRDASATHFTPEEKMELKERLVLVKKDLVSWLLSGSPDKNSTDARVANHTIMFKINKADHRLRDFSSYTIEEQVNKILKRSSGFGTGLSWTYATGSKGKKIQFKCPVL